jgi:hypothetical protein
MLKDDYETLDIEYKTNIKGSPAIDALNKLNDVDRSLMIKFIECKSHYTKLAKEMGVGVDLIKEKINPIREKFKVLYEEELRNG